MKYEETHPWINFQLDLQRADCDFWFCLGALQSKCVHIAQAPLLPEVSKKLHLVYLAKGAHGTTAIEGNSLPLEDVEKLVEQQPLNLPASKEYLGAEVENIIKACNELKPLVFNQERNDLKLTVEMICEFNRKVLEGLEVGEEVIPGKIRDHSVGVFSYKAPLAEECEYLLQKLCDWINDDEFDLGKGKEIATGVLKAVVAHLYLAWIHAFSDGNGRTARLVELALLLSCGVPTAAAHLLSNFYNETRPAYYAALNKSSKERTRGALHFIEYAIKGFREELKSQLEVIQTSQMKVAWINYVHSKFSETKPSEAQKRRRDLILELTKQDKYTFTREEIRVLSPRIEQAYRDKTDRTLSRDLNCIEAMKLIKNEQKDYRMETTELLLQIIPLSLQDITSLPR